MSQQKIKDPTPPNAIGYQKGEHIRNNVVAFLEDHVKRDPKLTVLQWANPLKLKEWDGNPQKTIPHDKINATELLHSISHVAGGLKDLGIQKGDRVILFVPMSIQLYTAMFALQKIGAIPVFLDSWARRNHLGASAKIVSPRAMISFEKAYELCADVSELNEIPIKICVGPHQKNYKGYLEDLFKYPKPAETEAVEKEHTALITFTTGSSGVPKGANRTHRFLAAQHYALNACLPYTAQDVDLPVFPVFSLNNLAAGVSTVIPAFDIGVPGERDAETLLSQFQATEVTCTTLSPSLFNRLSAYCLQNNIQLKSLRRIVTGGAPVSLDNVKDFQKVAPHADIWVLFGSTEAEPMAHIEGREWVNLKTRAATDPEWVDEGVNVGHMADGLMYRFLKIQKGVITVQNASDWRILEVPPGEVGELIVAGEHVCGSYYNDEEAFKRAKILDENGVVWHRTGDLGRIDEKGYLWIVGRVHNAIARGGKYCFPVRAEMIMKKLENTRLCAYLGVPDPKLGEKTICVVVPHDLALLKDSSQLKSAEKELRRLMEKNGVPVDGVLFREKIPMDPRHHSKVEYEVLRKELKEAGLI